MNRLTALTIQREPWMTEQYYIDIIDLYGIEATQGDCPEIGLHVIFLEQHDENIFKLAQGEMNIIANLSLWFDDGMQEIHITEHNYRQFDSLLFYSERTGKYDQTPIEL